MPTILLKCCMFALITGVLALLLREIHGIQWSLLCVIAGGILLLMTGLTMFDKFILQIQTLVDKSGIQGTEWRALIKGSLICICGDFTGEFCKNTGQPLLAQGIEMVGRISLGILAVPFVIEMLSLVEDILQG